MPTRRRLGLSFRIKINPVALCHGVVFIVTVEYPACFVAGMNPQREACVGGADTATTKFALTPRLISAEAKLYKMLE